MFNDINDLQNEIECFQRNIKVADEITKEIINNNDVLLSMINSIKSIDEIIENNNDIIKSKLNELNNAVEIILKNQDIILNSSESQNKKITNFISIKIKTIILISSATMGISLVLGILGIIL